MVNELEKLLKSLKPKWEDPTEFDWIKNSKISSQERKIKYNSSNRTNY